MASLCPAYTGSDCHLLEELPDAPWELLPPPELIVELLLVLAVEVLRVELELPLLTLRLDELLLPLTLRDTLWLLLLREAFVLVLLGRL